MPIYRYKRHIIAHLLSSGFDKKAADKKNAHARKKFLLACPLVSCSCIWLLAFSNMCASKLAGVGLVEVFAITGEPGTENPGFIGTPREMREVIPLPSDGGVPLNSPFFPHATCLWRGTQRAPSYCFRFFFFLVTYFIAP